jgi:hypothetical protein
VKTLGRVLLGCGTVYVLLVLGAFLTVHDFANSGRWIGMIADLAVAGFGALIISRNSA